ncbi:MAG TPA: tRNA lysidine(34) synthetase TilS [Burkholderiales bacterium]
MTEGGSRAEGLVARVAAQLKEVVQPSDRLVTGLSGGVDSVVLLDVLQQIARTLRFRLSALHINHQLSTHATRWSAFCRDLCRRRGIPYKSVRVKIRRGDSLEAAARDARYAVFARQRCDFVVLAHHRDDQVETLLLQLLRGAGVKGLAAMPLLRKAEGRRQKPSLLRPLLDVTREEILDYARKRTLEWIEDESNQDIYFHRNFIRHEVLPLIARRFPAYRVTLARAAGHLAEAAQVLDELAAADAAGHLEGGTLSMAAFQHLPPARARNLLRYLLASHRVPMPNAERIDEALRQALCAKRDAQVRIELGGCDLRRFENRLHVVAAMKDLPARYARRWRGQSAIVLPELGGVLAMPRAWGAGISLARLRGRPVTIGVRRGGERLQPDCRRPRRSLKNLLQECRVPPWQRGRLPLLLCGDELVWAAGIGVDCRYQATGAEPGVQPAWSAIS